MCIGHLGEIIDGALAIDLDNLISRLEAIGFGDDDMDIRQTIGSFGNRDDGIVMLKDKGDIAQRSIGYMPISIAAEQVEEIFVEGIFVLVFSGLDVALDIIEGFIQINGIELEFRCWRLREIGLGRVKLKVQPKLLEGVLGVISLEGDINETVVGRFSGYVAIPRSYNFQNGLMIYFYFLFFYSKNAGK